MALDPISAGLDFAGKLVDRLWPDPTQAAAAKLELLKLAQSGDLAQMQADTDIAKGQLGIDLAEAASPHWFVAAWRPAVGWVGVVSLALIYWPYAVVSTALWGYTSWRLGVLQAKPDLGVTDLLGLIGPMLGIAGLRSVEKVQGVATAAITLPFAQPAKVPG